MFSHSPGQWRYGLWMMFFLCCPALLFAGNPVRDANAILSEKFDQYETKLDAFIHAMNQSSWSEAEQLASTLTNLSEELMAMGQKNKNPTWEYYASNLTHHGQELQEACKQQDPDTSVHLVASLINHLGEIQSAIPVWLLEYLSQRIKELELGIDQKNAHQTRDAAEILHTAAHKIILSASTSRQSYRHTRWLANILDLNRLGDELLTEPENNDWNISKQHLQKIKALYAIWQDGFHPELIQ
ncbi:MAG: hypothetical protein H7839_05270 [Magnetococcus sp. YQC-5]